MCEKCSPRTIGRRGLLAGGLALAAAPLLASSAFAQTSPAAPVSPDEALKRLVEGNARYVANKPLNVDHSADRVMRSRGQRPFAAIVACSDSRVVPELVFDQGPGELFIVRVAGNFINEDGLASLEFGAAVLGVKLVVVLGHTSCGAVEATITSIRDKTLPPGHLPSLVNALRPAVYDAMRSNPSDLLAAATAQNAKLNAKLAESTTPILSAQAATGNLKSAAAVYDIGTGKVSFL
ncbi:carbonic anhydrase [Xanthobacter pseudotagetidis]|uniref:carbonic anhydrase n=1 Tax=Xanthobacter pseudotagetidis TaxID=3119911 RepID=UPI00372CB944